jgi:hypothetical protein
VRIEQRDENASAATLIPVGDTPVASFSRVLKNRSFLLLWLAQLLSQIVFNAANYGVIAIVTAITHSTVMVGLAIVSFAARASPGLVRQCLAAGDRRAGGTICRHGPASARPGYAPHFSARGSRPGAWRSNHAFTHAAVGQEPHHRSRQPVYCCR